MGDWDGEHRGFAWRRKGDTLHVYAVTPEARQAYETVTVSRLAGPEGDPTYILPVPTHGAGDVHVKELTGKLDYFLNQHERIQTPASDFVPGGGVDAMRADVVKLHEQPVDQEGHRMVVADLEGLHQTSEGAARGGGGPGPERPPPGGGRSAARQSGRADNGDARSHDRWAVHAA